MKSLIENDFKNCFRMYQILILNPCRNVEIDEANWIKYWIRNLHDTEVQVEEHLNNCVKTNKEVLLVKCKFQKWL